LGIKRELQEKMRRVREFLRERNYDALLLSKQSNFAWFTGGGDSHVVIADSLGVASLVILPDKKYLLTDNIEAGRILEEELSGQGYEVKIYNWHESKRKKEILEELTGGMRVASDDGFPGTIKVEEEFAPYRWSLTPEEIRRYRWLGNRSGRALSKVAYHLRPGLTEQQIAGRLSAELMHYGIVPVVLLIAADDRIAKYRHPIPTDRRVQKYVMLVVGGRKWGLIVSLTRLVHFGGLSSELRRRHHAVVKVDATFIAHSRPGTRMTDIFARVQRVYAETGFPDEWRLHHQGGPTGYEARDYKCVPGHPGVVVKNQALAWNPSITGTKSEDTIVAFSEGPEIITLTPDWPTIAIEMEGVTIERPDIFVR